jgi:hypothetical protein
MSGRRIARPTLEDEDDDEHEDDEADEIKLLTAPKIKYKPGCCLGWVSPGLGGLWRRNRISFS